MIYLIAPFAAWFVAGSLKFAINFLIHRKKALSHVGLGGFPSNHTTIVVTMASLVAFKEGIDSAGFGVAITLAVIVVIDAMDLRRRIGHHAEKINSLTPEASEKLREKVGHRWSEVLGGAVLGWGIGFYLGAASLFIEGAK